MNAVMTSSQSVWSYISKRKQLKFRVHVLIPGSNCELFNWICIVCCIWLSLVCRRPYWTVEVDSKFNCSSISHSVVHSCKMYLSFCQVLPISKTDPAGFCREEDEEAGLHRNASMCMVINKELDNQTANTFGTYLPRQDPFKALSVGMYTFLPIAWGTRYIFCINVSMC